MSLLYEKVVQEDLNVGTTATAEVANPAGGTLLGTQIGLHSFALGQVAYTATWDPSTITSSSYEAKSITVPGAAVGDFVLASHNKILTNDLMISGNVSAADTVQILIFNPSAGDVDLDSGTLYVLVFKAKS